MEKLFKLSGSVEHDEAVAEWLSGEPANLYSIARRWFSRMRDCGSDVAELLHDGCPVACVDGAALGYVNVFKAHVNIGFFRGAFLKDPSGLLEGSGKRMRHIKLRPDQDIDAAEIERLLEAAYRDIKAQLG